MKKLLIFGLIFASVTLTGCSQQEITPETQKQIQDNTQSGVTQSGFSNTQSTVDILIWNETSSGIVSSSSIVQKMEPEIKESDNIKNLLEDRNVEFIGCLGYSFQTCSPIYKDDKGVFTNGNKWGEDIRLDMIDAKTVEPVFYPDDHNITLYIKDKNNIWYPYEKYDSQIPIKMIEGFNVSQFKMLSGTGEGNYGDDTFRRYITDGSNIYYGHQKISSNPESFQIFSGTLYSKDRDNVFFHGFILTGAISDSFEMIPHASKYSKDRDNVYFDADVISGVDPASFRVILQQRVAADYIAIAADARNIYCGSVLCFSQADPQTLNLVESWDPPFFKDKNFVYFGEEIIEGADPASFSVFKRTTYSKDKEHIFFNAKIFNEADSATFAINESMDGSGRVQVNIYDKNHTYDFLGKIVK